jgi:hypothetical protein
MNVYLIITIVLVISAAVYFLFFFKGGAKKYFNKTLVAIDAHKKKSLPGSTPKTSLRARLPMLNKGKLMTTSDQKNPIIDFGEEANGLLNDMLNNISNKLCNKDATKKFPMSNNNYNEVSISVLLTMINSDKFSSQEKEDYLAALALIENNNFSIEGDMVKILDDKDKKIAKLFMPSLDITKDVLLSFEDFKTLNFNAINSIFDVEKSIQISKIDDPSIPIIKVPNTISILNSYPIIIDGGLINDLIMVQNLSGNKMTEEEKNRFNIYIFGGEADPNLFNTTNDDLLSPFVKIFNKIDTADMPHDKKQYIRNIISHLLMFNDVEVTDQDIVDTRGDTEPIVIELDKIRDNIEALKDMKNQLSEMICELI